MGATGLRPGAGTGPGGVSARLIHTRLTVPPGLGYFLLLASVSLSVNGESDTSNLGSLWGSVGLCQRLLCKFEHVSSEMGKYSLGSDYSHVPLCDSGTS